MQSPTKPFSYARRRTPLKLQRFTLRRFPTMPSRPSTPLSLHNRALQLSIGFQFVALLRVFPVSSLLLYFLLTQNYSSPRPQAKHASPTFWRACVFPCSAPHPYTDVHRCLVRSPSRAPSDPTRTHRLRASSSLSISSSACSSSGLWSSVWHRTPIKP